MRIRKLIPFALSCLLVLETPLVSQAAEVSPVSDISVQAETLTQNETLTQAETPTRTETLTQDETPTRAETPARAETLTQDETDADPETDFDITLSQNTAQLNVGSTLQLTASVLGYDDSTANPPQITWSSEYPDIASVSTEGLVTAVKAGTATITATAVLETAEQTYTASCSCTVTVKNTITLNKKKLTLYTFQKETLSATAVPAGTVTWQSSDTSIVSVNSKGKLTPKKAGTANITATANGVSASCKITVKEPKLKLASSKTIYLKNPITLTATATPKGKITWKSSNPKIASVSSKGKVTPKSIGTASITASCNGLKKTCKVTVKKPSVKFKTKNIIIFADNDYTLTPSAHPATGLSYRSSKPKIAKVSKDGTVTGVRPGTVTITASIPGAKASCEVTVLKNIYKLNRSSQTLMKGSSATIYMSNTSANDYVSYESSDWSVADLSTSGNTCKIKARQAGKTTLNAYYSIYKDGHYVTCKRSCTIKVIDSGIVQQEAAIATGTEKALTLKHVNKSGATITDTSWKSSNSKVASIDRKTGKVKGKKFGSAKITATVSYSDGTAKEYTSNIKVSTPRIASKYTVLSLGNSQRIALSGLTSYSNTTWKLKKKSLVSIAPDGTVFSGYTAGKTTVTIKTDGKSIKHTIIVTNPGLKSSYVTLAPNGTAQIPLSGVCAQSKITYSSLNNSVAAVSGSGVVTARNYGTAKIAVKADGSSFTFEVDVAPQRAIDACKTGYSIMYSSTYSQAYRMTTGFYDCSSLAFRAYGCDAGLLGGSRSWAPTAADMAKYLESHGKAIAYRGLDSSQLLPGDLIFYGGDYNGRYKNIYHVSMYYGGSYRLEKPLRYYYPEGNIVMIARPVR